MSHNTDCKRLSSQFADFRGVICVECNCESM